MPFGILESMRDKLQQSVVLPRWSPVLLLVSSPGRHGSLYDYFMSFPPKWKVSFSQSRSRLERLESLSATAAFHCRKNPYKSLTPFENELVNHFSIRLWKVLLVSSR